MKDYAWKLAERYPNHEKHMSLRDGVEMEVEGHGDRWTWNVRSVTGAYIAKDGHAESLRVAKDKAEGAANGVRALSVNAVDKRADILIKLYTDRARNQGRAQVGDPWRGRLHNLYVSAENAIGRGLSRQEKTVLRDAFEDSYKWYGENRGRAEREREFVKQHGLTGKYLRSI